MWKSAYVGVYQLLNWKMHGETLKLVVIYIQASSRCDQRLSIAYLHIYFTISLASSKMLTYADWDPLIITEFIKLWYIYYQTISSSYSRETNLLLPHRLGSCHLVRVLAMACNSYIYNPHLHLRLLYQDQHSANETICRNPRHTVPNLLRALKKWRKCIQNLQISCKYHLLQHRS